MQTLDRRYGSVQALLESLGSLQDPRNKYTPNGPLLAGLDLHIPQDHEGNEDDNNIAPYIDYPVANVKCFLRVGLGMASHDDWLITDLTQAFAR